MIDLKSLPSLGSLKKVGFIVPSSNTTLEPITAAMGSQFSNLVSFHFSRLQVKTIDTDARSTNQFDTTKMLAAAQLLQDAHPDVILWNGTSGSWNGNDVHAEMALAKDLAKAMGVSASTSTLAQIDVLWEYGIKKIAIVSPYADGPARALVTFYSSLGFEVVGSAQMNETDNVGFASTPLERIQELVREADSDDAEAVVVPCTNWPAAMVVEEMERELGKIVFDSVCVTLWKALRLVGIDVKVRGWGKLMAGEER